MKETKISLFKELYYWMHFYISTYMLFVTKIRKEYPPVNVGFGVSLLLSILRTLNLSCLLMFIEYIDNLNGVEYTREQHNLMALSMIVIAVTDLFLFYRKRERIIEICEQFSKKRRIAGKIKFWSYVVLTTVMLLCFDKLFR
jgi:ABC-type nickel/cobalt efflux system permease component RcnA